MRLRALPLLVCLGACAGLVLATGADAEARAKKKKAHGAVRGARHQKGGAAGGGGLGGNAVGKFHLRKANALAGSNHCEQAVREYTLAYFKLRDPVVLFNRAECYRRMGEAGRAASDYRGFLTGVPTAPNREEIEARIAVLEGSGLPLEDKPPPPAPEPKPRPAPAATAVAATAAGGGGALAAGAAPAPRPPAPSPSSSPAAAVARVDEPAPTPALGLDDDVSAPPPLVDSKPAAVVTSKPEEHSSHWWVWVTLGVVVAGGAAAGYLLLRPQGQTIPATSLGDYRF